MAISAGKQTTENNNFERKLYIGVASSKVLGVNVNAEEYEKLRGFKPQGEMNYLAEIDTDEGKIKQAIISFIVKPADGYYLDSKNEPIDTTAIISFRISKQYFIGKATGKYQVIDKYGRTAWATKEDIQNKRIPMYSNGPANIDVDYRPTMRGEAELTEFLKNFLNIPDPDIWDNETRTRKMKPADQLAECEIRIDDINAIFNGNFKEIKDAINYQPNNLIKLIYGVRTSNDGRQYQTIWTKFTMKNFTNKYDRAIKELENSKAAGGLNNVEYNCSELHEYVVTPTNLSQAPNLEMPKTETVSPQMSMPFDNSLDDLPF